MENFHLLQSTALEQSTQHCKKVIPPRKATTVVRELGACAIQLDNAGLHQIRSNKEPDGGQQASHCLKSRSPPSTRLYQNQREGLLGIFTRESVLLPLCGPGLVPVFPLWDACPLQKGTEATSTYDWVPSALGHRRTGHLSWLPGDVGNPGKKEGKAGRPARILLKVGTAENPIRGWRVEKQGA